MLYSPQALTDTQTVIHRRSDDSDRIEGRGSAVRDYKEIRMNLYVSNISPGVAQADLQHIFSGLGEILYASLTPADAGRSNKGYAFVYVPDDDRARAAIARLNGAVLKGGRLAVSPMAERPGVIGNYARARI